MSSFHYFPLTGLFLLGLFLVLVLLVGLIQLRILKYAYRRIGLSPRAAFLVLVLSLLGSFVNIPLFELPPEEKVAEREITYFGVQYVVPEVQHTRGTIVALNVGGGLIPTLVSLYLIVKNRLFLSSLASVAMMSAIVHFLAQPVRGVGIAVPTFLPPLAASVIATLVSFAAVVSASKRSRASDPVAVRRIQGLWKPAPLAYIAGTLGSLIGADLLNLDKIRGLGAPVASIGGAGTFDGIFMTGILAVLLATITAPASMAGDD